METTEEVTCACGQPFVCVINGKPSCEDCLDKVIGDALSGVRTALGDYYAQASEDV